jgi:hypothetical protein
VRRAFAHDSPPLEALTLTGVMEELAGRGFTEHFIAVAGGLRARRHGDLPAAADIRYTVRVAGAAFATDLEAFVRR